MKYIKEFGIILGISFVGEGLHYLIPAPIPASIYGLVLMLLLLVTGILKLEKVKATADFMIEIMPMMFIPAAVGLINSWGLIKPRLLSYVIVMTVSLVVVMVISGKVAEWVIKRDKV